MYWDANKKTLFVIGIDQDLPPLLQQATKIKPENMLTLQIYEPEISQPYGDLMRDIILAIYQENVRDICVVGTRWDEMDTRDLQNKIYEQVRTEETIKTLDFLFQYCKPEFQGIALNEWLQGSKPVNECIQNSVKFLRDHPFIPSSVRIYGCLMDKENSRLSEIHIS